jgi:hypothetical protein
MDHCLAMDVLHNGKWLNPSVSFYNCFNKNERAQSGSFFN